MITSIKAIILDFGGVIFTGKLEDIQHKLAQKIGLPQSVFIEQYNRHARALVTGTMPAEEFAKELARTTHKTSHEILDSWRNIYLETMNMNPNILAVLESLKKQYIVTAITNTNSLHAALNKSRGTYDCVDSIIISCDVGLAKPDVRIFQKILARYNLKPEECIFIDDRSENIIAAKTAGFHTIRYEGIPHMIRTIRNLSKANHIPH